jgi:hypothetical protein
MPSSTSNSKQNQKTDYYFNENRPIPEGAWLKAIIIALIIMFAGLIAWEYNARSWGYDPQYYIDSKGLWAVERRKIDSSDASTVVLIGASRIFFDLDLNTYEELTGKRPIQLALVGTNPRPILADLAKDEDFIGTLIVGITPGSFFRDGGGRSGNMPEYYAKESPTQWLSQQLSMLIEPHLAFYDNENWPLFTLIERIPMQNRGGVFDPRMGVWYISDSTKDRNTKMFWKVEEDPEYQHKAQMTWRGFMEMADKRGPADFDLDIYMDGVVKDIDKIRSRGGDVVFIRPPSSGDYRPREARLQPRDKFWDRLLEQTNSIGVHFEDYPELQGLRTPEWSHLHSEDSLIYTRNIVPILDAKLKETGKKGLID